MVFRIFEVCQCRRFGDNRTVCECNCAAYFLFTSAVNCPFYCNEVSGQDAKVIMDSAGEAHASCTGTSICTSSSCSLTVSTFRLEKCYGIRRVGSGRLVRGKRIILKWMFCQKSCFEYFVLRGHSGHKDVDLKEIITGVYLQQFSLKLAQKRLFGCQRHRVMTNFILLTPCIFLQLIYFATNALWNTINK
jgi:hypothetical protein